VISVAVVCVAMMATSGERAGFIRAEDVHSRHFLYGNQLPDDGFLIFLYLSDEDK
jgi:hypothetical protein